GPRRVDQTECDRGNPRQKQERERGSVQGPARTPRDPARPPAYTHPSSPQQPAPPTSHEPPTSNALDAVPPPALLRRVPRRIVMYMGVGRAVCKGEAVAYLADASHSFM